MSGVDVSTQRFSQIFIPRRSTQPHYFQRHKLVTRPQHTWINEAQKCHKWTQTEPSRIYKDQGASMDYWIKGTFLHSVLQVDINRVIKLYKLSRMKDLNSECALRDLMLHHEVIRNDKKAWEMLKKRLSKAISYKKYYEKKRNFTQKGYPGKPLRKTEVCDRLKE